MKRGRLHVMRGIFKCTSLFLHEQYDVYVLRLILFIQVHN